MSRRGRHVYSCVARLAVALVIIALCATVVGCGEGNARRVALADWALYEDPGGAFHFRYPEPPWDIVDDTEMGNIVLEIPHTGIIAIDLPVEILQVSVESACTGTLMACAQAGIVRLEDLLNDDLVLLVSPVEFTNFFVDDGMTFSYDGMTFSYDTLETGIKGIEYYIAGKNSIVSARFGGVQAVDLPEYGLVGGSLEPRLSGL